MDLKMVQELKNRVHSLEEANRQDKVKLNKALSGGYITKGGGSEGDVFVKAIHASALQASGLQHHEALKRVGLNSYTVDNVLNATQKAMDTGTGGSGGGFVVPNEYVTSFIDSLRAKLVVVRAGATLMQKLSGSPVYIPKQLTSSTVSWVGQNTTIPTSDPSFGQISMTPKTMATRAQYSNLLHLLSNPAMEDIIREDFARVAAIELDRVALRGSGSSNQPLGLNGVAGVSTYSVGTNGGPLTADDLYELVGKIEDADAMGDTLALITHPKALRKLKKQRIANYSGQTDGSYLVQPLLTDEALSKAIGLKCLTTTQLPINLTKGTSSDCTEVFVANWSDLLIGQWGDVEILATNIGGNAWAQNAIEIRLVMNVDIQTRHPESFVYCADAKTA